MNTQANARNAEKTPSQQLRTAKMGSLEQIFKGGKMAKKLKKAAKTAKAKSTKKVKPEGLKPYQDEKQLRKMYPKMTAGEISRKFNVSRSVILYYIKKFGIKITTRTSPKSGQRRSYVDRSFHKKGYLEKQLRAGKTIYKIATECNCAFGQVKHMVEKHSLIELAKEVKAKKKPTKKK